MEEISKAIPGNISGRMHEKLPKWVLWEIDDQILIGISEEIHGGISDRILGCISLEIFKKNSWMMYEGIPIVVSKTNPWSNFGINS